MQDNTEQMATEECIKQIRKDIDQLLELEGVSVQVVEEGFLPLGGTVDNDTLLSVVFEDSVAEDPRATVCRLEVVIRFKRCVYGINKRRETVITLGVEVPPDFPVGHIILELLHVANGASQLTKICARALSEASSVLANDTLEDRGLYRLVSAFYWFIKDQLTSQAEVNSSLSRSLSYKQRSLQSIEEPSSHSFNDDSITDFSHSIDGSSSNYYSPRSGEMSTTSRKEDQMFHQVMATYSRYYREFEQEKVLGSGSFGCVTKVRRNGISYAVKQIPIYKSYGTTLHEEAAVLASLQHRHIVRYYDAWMENPYEEMVAKELAMHSKQHISSLYLSRMHSDLQLSIPEIAESLECLHSGYRVVQASQRKVRFRKQPSFKNRGHKKRTRNGKPIKYLFILMEYCAEDNLFDAVCDRRFVESPLLVVELFRQILEALSYIHEKGIIHRDVKPSNIFLMSEGEALSIKLGDFGLTAKLSREASSVEEGGCPSGVVGTLHYMSPEQARGEAYDEKVDIFAAGVVLFEMLSPPFSTAMERFDILSSFSTTEKKWPSEFQSRVDYRLFKILESMLNVDPSKRPSASQLLQNEIFASSKLDTSTLYSVITQYPHSMESSQLLSSIFGRRESHEKEFAYFEGLGDENVETNYVNVELARRYAHEFRSRGAVRYEAPLFVYPKSDNSVDGKPKDPYLLLLSDGRSCQLRTSVLSALAESIPQTFLVIMRRWYWGKLYHKGSTSGQHPLETWACGYDIITDYNILFQEMGPEEEVLDAFFCAELLMTATRPLLKFVACNISVEWTYTSLIRRVLEDAIGVRDTWSYDLEELILKHHTRQNILKRELNEYLRSVTVQGLTSDGLSNCIMQLVSSIPTGAVSSLKEFLATITKVVSTTGKNISRFTAFVNSLLYMERFLTIKDCNFLFVPLGFQPWHRSRYTKFSFSINYALGKKTFPHLASGGCINSMLPQRKGTLLDPPHRNVFGFEINLQPLIQHFSQQDATALGRGKMESLQLGYHLFPQVLICISHSNLLPQAMILEHLLQKAGIITEKQLGLPGNFRKLQKQVSIGLVNLSRLEIMVHIKYLSTGGSVPGLLDSERNGASLQYKLVYTVLGNEVCLSDDKELLCLVCSHIYKRYL